MNRAAMRSILVGVVLLAVAVIVEAQQPKKVFRIGFLDNGTASGIAVLIGAVPASFLFMATRMPQSQAQESQIQTT